MRDSSWTYRGHRKKIASRSLFFASNLCFSSFFFAYCDSFLRARGKLVLWTRIYNFLYKETHVLPASGPNIEFHLVLTPLDIDCFECVFDSTARFSARTRFSRFASTSANRLTPALSGLCLPFFALLLCSCFVAYFPILCCAYTLYLVCNVSVA